MAEKSVFERLRDETQRRTVAVLALLGLVYAYFFLPESVLNYFREGLGSLWSNLVSLGLVTSIGGVLGYVISALDLLATGEGQAARFFRRQYPSAAVVEKYTARKRRRIICGSTSSTRGRISAP